MHEESRFSSGGVQCPLCRSHDLVERNGVVLCPAGDLRLDLRNEGLTLDHVRCVSVASCLIHICAWCFKVMYEGHKLCAYALLKPCHRMHNSYVMPKYCACQRYNHFLSNHQWQEAGNGETRAMCSSPCIITMCSSPAALQLNNGGSMLC